MKLSAAELEYANNVAFIVSGRIYNFKIKMKKFSYNSLFFNCIYRRIDIILGDKRYSSEHIHYNYNVKFIKNNFNLLIKYKMNPPYLIC